MKVTLNWLKQYVDFDWSPEELTERLTMLGLEVEGVVKLGGEFQGIVVAQVITRDKHPNADKLSVCRVTDGTTERQIVCGAQNFKAGDKVPLILAGSTLPSKPGEQPFTIKVGKIRGVESFGMMCSQKELGLAEDADGLMILPEEAKVGQPFAEHLGRSRNDVVYDLEVTPNRPDLNSVIGIAREISALTGNPLKWPVITHGEQSACISAASMVAVELEDTTLCPRYVARVIKGVKIGPSPDWLKSMLEKVGLRSISNVVDVTNFVMLESGQPLHAFDYHLIAKDSTGKPTIVVRRASADEKFVTLDGQTHTLNTENLLIADPAKGIALAGVMGGQNTEIKDTTVDVLLESAYFNPTSIRRTSKKLGLRTDASYRFERGIDVGLVEWASQRATQLIVETAGGTVATGAVDAYPVPVSPRAVSLRPEKAAQLLGVPVTRTQCESFLLSLGLKISTRVPVPVAVDAPPNAPQPPLIFSIPSFRVDLKREVDLIEEVGRLYGIENIPSAAPRGSIGSNPFDAVHDQYREVRQILSGLGLNEAQGQTLISNADCYGVVPENLALLANSLSSDMNALRPSLLPGLVHSLRNNVSRKNMDIALFEIGRVFSKVNGKLVEERRIGFALTGKRYPAFWSGADRDAKADVFDLKGILEEFFEQFGLKGISFTKRPDCTALFLESASIQIGGKIALGEIGQLLPALGKKYDLRDPVLLAELRLDELVAKRNANRQFKPLPAYPAIQRDVAMIVDEAVSYDAIMTAVRKAKPQNLVNVEVFDVFRGKNVPVGQKSMACSFTYRHSDKTLTDTEVNGIHENLVNQLKQTVPVTVRES